MLSIIGAAAIALLVTLIVLVRQREDSSRLAGPRAPLPTMGVQIICGDCAGKEGAPRKTFVNRHGRCDNCGGSSYVLASSMAVAGLRHSASRFSKQTGERRDNRVLLFDKRAAESRKIAI